MCACDDATQQEIHNLDTLNLTQRCPYNKPNTKSITMITNRSSLLVCFLVWVVAVMAEALVFKPAIAAPTFVRSRTKMDARPNDDFSRIFGAEEARERMRENAVNYVSPKKSKASTEDENATTPKDPSADADFTNTTKVVKSGEKG